VHTDRARPAGASGELRARAGDDPAALGRFYDAALAEVYPYLLRRCGQDRETAQDLTQETFVSAVSALERGAVASISIGWLVTVARSRLIDHYRRQARRDRPLRLLPSAVTEPADTEVLSVGTVEALLTSLPPKQRLAVVLHHLDGLPVGEVADLTGTSVRAVESTLARARRTLRAAAEEWR
jgi:RNA polymerase sigma-70 factor, ECF subfamily